MSSVLVTGAAGFIGKALCKNLVGNGIEVFGIVRKREQAEELRALGVTPILADLSSPELFKEQLLESEFVFHLGGNATFGNTGDYESSNIGATRGILEILKESKKLKRLIFTSTIGAVDRSKTDPCRDYLDTTSVPCPTSVYGQSKLKCEEMIKESGLRYAILRPSWVYGPGMRVDSHIYVFLRACFENKLLSRIGFSGQVSLIYIEDMVECLVSCMRADKDVDILDFVDDGVQKTFYEIFRVGRTLCGLSEPFKIPTLFSEMLRPLVSFIPFQIKCLLYPALACKNSLPEILDWKAKVDYQEGLKRTLDYVKSRPEGVWIVTGAASGIGRAYVDNLKAKSKKVLLVDRSSDVTSLGSELGMDSLVVDLASDEAASKIESYVKAKNLFVEGLVNCAGFGLRGPVTGHDLKEIDSMVRVNLTTPVQLCKLFLPAMLKNGVGSIVNVSSSVAEVPLPGMALYAASKAAMSSFSNALWGEVRGSAVKVLTVCPSGTKTSFQSSAGVKVLKGGEGLMSPEEVAKETFSALEQSKVHILLGWKSKILLFVSRFMPRSVKILVWKKMMESSR